MTTKKTNYKKQIACLGMLLVLSVLLSGFLAQSNKDNPQKKKKATPKVESFTFVAMADTHCDSRAIAKFPGMGTAAEKYLRAVRKINKLQGDDKPDFVVITGDARVWKLSKEVRDNNYNLDMPVYVLFGNHSSPNDRKNIRKKFPKAFQVDGKSSDYFSFVHKGTRIICLCTNPSNDHYGQLCDNTITPSGQCEWLESVLAKPEKHKLLFGHSGITPEDKDRNMYFGYNTGIFIKGLFKKYKPTAYFHGHTHRHHEYTVAGTHCVNVPSTYYNNNYAPLGFLVVRVTPKGITTKFVEVKVDE